MKSEIKEIKFFEYDGIEGYIELMKHDVEPLNNPDCKSIELYYEGKDIKAVLDYITNLQTIEQQYSAILSENAELENKITILQEELEEEKRIEQEDFRTIQNLEEENERLKEENKRIFSHVNDDELLISNAMNYAEAQRLNNIINELEEWLEKTYQDEALNKLNELKGDN